MEKDDLSMRNRLRELALEAAEEDEDDNYEQMLKEIEDKIAILRKNRGTQNEMYTDLCK